MVRADQILALDDDAILGADDSLDRSSLAFVFAPYNHHLNFYLFVDQKSKLKKNKNQALNREDANKGEERERERETNIVASENLPFWDEFQRRLPTHRPLELPPPLLPLLDDGPGKTLWPFYADSQIGPGFKESIVGLPKWHALSVTPEGP